MSLYTSTAALQGVADGVRNFAGLFSARLFLGMTEAGLFPGVSFFLTQWYRRYEINFRIALFFAAATAAGAFGGLLARLINFMDGVAGLQGWRWIFILEVSQAACDALPGCN